MNYKFFLSTFGCAVLAVLCSPVRAETAAKANKVHLNDPTNPTGIRIKFYPSLSSYAKDCSEIGFVQFMKMEADYGKSSLMHVKRGQIRKSDAWIDATASNEGYTVDTAQTLTAMTKPYGSYISTSNKRHKKYIWTNDAPQIGTSNLPLPPFDAVRSPGGWKRMIYTFYTLAYCNAGTQQGLFYEGVKWRWVIPANKANASYGFGTITLIDDDVSPPAAGSHFHDALNKFVKAQKQRHGSGR